MLLVMGSRALRTGQPVFALLDTKIAIHIGVIDGVTVFIGSAL